MNFNPEGAKKAFTINLVPVALAIWKTRLIQKLFKLFTKKLQK